MLTEKQKQVGPSFRAFDELFNYNAESGVLSRKPVQRDNYSNDRDYNLVNSRISGKECNSRNVQGYLQVRVLGLTWKVHRISWLLYYGDWPEKQLDHINGIKTDNRIVNLREVTSLENCKNLPKKLGATSKHLGVSWHRRDKKWQASIKVGSKSIYLGYFDSQEEAYAARKKADVKYGFHENHGRAS